MKRAIHRFAYCGLLAVGLVGNAIATDFEHPGISHSQKSIDFVKARIEAGTEPWATAWKGVQVSRSADLDWRPQPHARVERVTDVLEEGDEVLAKCIDIDPSGRIRLSRKEALADAEAEGKGEGAEA